MFWVVFALTYSDSIALGISARKKCAFSELFEVTGLFMAQSVFFVLIVIWQTNNLEL